MTDAERLILVATYADNPQGLIYGNIGTVLVLILFILIVLLAMTNIFEFLLNFVYTLFVNWRSKHKKHKE